MAAASRYHEYGLIYYAQVSPEQLISAVDVTTARRFTAKITNNAHAHIALEGETFRSIADLYFNTQQSWWALADFNPEVPLDEGSFGLKAGTAIKVPPKSLIA